MQKLEKGDYVVMHTCGEASVARNYGKVWTCKSDQFTNYSGEEVVYLNGYTGYFSVKYLQKINLSSALKFVWLDPVAGKFGNTFEHDLIDIEDTLEELKRMETNYKLIGFVSPSHPDFEFTEYMKLR